ncbi:hypothetical protein VIBNISO65_1030053 [Vibrio nigripulchritudo SO65]|nr:hypothetical protein VIBNISO65_1030053 [Vibrio nigripulchritudo SO65]
MMGSQYIPQGIRKLASIKLSHLVAAQKMHICSMQMGYTSTLPKHILGASSPLLFVTNPVNIYFRNQHKILFIQVVKFSLLNLMK